MIPGLANLWNETLGDPRVCIAVLDGPVDLTHPCFLGAQLSSLPTLISETAGEGRMSTHGTHVASLIFGQPNSQVRGIAPNCRGLIGPIFSDADDGPSSQMDLARAINAAVAAGAHIINISGGELSNSGGADPLLVNAVRNCDDEGVLTVAAGGNDACRCLHVPAALPSVLAVGAMNSQGMPLESSNWGDAYQSQGILAPGENMFGAIPGGGFSLKTGTSFATPVVSAVVALLLSLQMKRGLPPDAQAVRDVLLASALPCSAETESDCQRFLSGRLNLPGAIALLANLRRIPMSVGAPVSDAVVASEIEPCAPSTAAGVAAQGETSRPEPSGIVAAAASAGRPAEARAGVVRPAEIAGNFGTAALQSGTGVAASECGCGGSGSKNYVFAIGIIGYDFGSEARRDGFKAQMPAVTPELGIPFRGGDNDSQPYPANPYDARQMVNYLGGYPPVIPPYPIVGGFPSLPGSPATFPGPVPSPPDGYPGFGANVADAAELIWTLNIELTPIYAIRPMGTFSTEVYQRLIQILAGQVRPQDDPEYVSRVSLPGILTTETVQLFSGQIIPVVVPNLRLMYAWNENVLVTSAIQAAKLQPGAAAKPMTEVDETAVHDTLRGILDRLYYDLRNLGQSSSERAINFAATNAFQFAKISSSEVVTNGLQLADIVTERSSFCRKDSDCWDVKLRFFNPNNVLEAKLVFRFTMDVSDVNPVSIGPMRSWHEAD